MNEEDYTLGMYDADEREAFRLLSDLHVSTEDMEEMIEDSFRLRFREIIARYNPKPLPSSLCELS